MSVNLTNFVSIVIDRANTTTIESTRDTVALFSTLAKSVSGNIYSSSAEVDAGETDSAIKFFAQVYFAFGGQKLDVRKSTLTTVAASEISALPENEICVVSTQMSVSQVNTLAQKYYSSLVTNNKYEATDEKLFFVGTSNYSLTSDLVTGTITKNVCVKYCANNNLSTKNAAVMMIPAYLSQIDVYGIDTVKDYMYTINAGIVGSTAYSVTDISNTDYLTLMSNNYNVDINLANQIRACGGNLLLSTNESIAETIVNQFIKIVLYQTTTMRMLNLMSQKIANMTGVAKIYSTLSEELDRYRKNGYLTTDKIYAEPDWTVSVNGQQYTICEKGTALTNGYQIVALPMSALTDEQRAAHSAPPIYIVIADQYAIRKIEIVGQVI